MSANATARWLRGTDHRPAADLRQAGRIAAAATLLLASGFQAISFLLTLNPQDTTEWLTWIANNPDRGQLAKLFDVLAMPFLVATAAVYIVLGRRRSPKLAWIAGVALGFGLVGLAMLQGWEVLAYNLVTDDVTPPATVATAVDNIASSPAGLAVMLPFLLVGFIGFLLTVISLWRSQAVPRAAVLIMLVGFIFDAFLARQLEGQLLGFISAAWIAVTILRTRAVPLAANDPMQT